MSICSVVYVVDNRKILIPYSVSVLILALGLPFFQQSKDILIGHYVNLLVFISISWLTSRIVYNGYYNNFIGRVMLAESKKLLENEIEENRKITLRLALANNQLTKLTLLGRSDGHPEQKKLPGFHRQDA